MKNFKKVNFFPKKTNHFIIFDRKRKIIKIATWLN